MKKYLWLSAIPILAGMLSCLAQQNPFKDGDRVCYIGSSIAMNGECFHFTNLFYATRYPERNILFFNCGISGEVTDQILNRIERDVLVNRPTWCVVMTEENDLRPALYRSERQNEPDIKVLQEEAVQHWMQNADFIVNKLLANGIGVILQTPTIFDQVVQSSAPNSYGINDNLKRCAEHLKALALKYSLPVVDCWTVLNNINNEIQKKDPTKTIIGYDRVHVGGLGHFIMSDEFLRTQQVNNKVSHAVINASKNSIVLSENCIISGLNANATSVSFNVKAASLPFPVPNEINPDSFFCFTDHMNADIIEVKGLKEDEHYVLDIDGAIISKFSAKELNKGINLTRYHNTPQYRQANKVLSRFREYWRNEKLLRTLKYVEYQHHNDLKDVKSIEELKTSMTAILDKYKQGPNYAFFTKMFESYAAHKPSEQALYEKAEDILRHISELNKPVMHIYTISKTGN